METLYLHSAENIQHDRGMFRANNAKVGGQKRKLVGIHC